MIVTDHAGHLHVAVRCPVRPHVQPFGKALEQVLEVRWKDIRRCAAIGAAQVCAHQILRREVKRLH